MIEEYCERFASVFSLLFNHFESGAGDDFNEDFLIILFDPCFLD